MIHKFVFLIISIGFRFDPLSSVVDVAVVVERELRVESCKNRGSSTALLVRKRLLAANGLFACNNTPV